jgi:hypothetical protein
MDADVRRPKKRCYSRAFTTPSEIAATNGQASSTPENWRETNHRSPELIAASILTASFTKKAR